MKRGESSALVVVTLSSGNPAKPTEVTRKLTADNKSEWKLNGTCARASAAPPPTRALTRCAPQPCRHGDDAGQGG